MIWLRVCYSQMQAVSSSLMTTDKTMSHSFEVLSHALALTEQGMTDIRLSQLCLSCYNHQGYMKIRRVRYVNPAIARSWGVTKVTIIFLHINDLRKLQV